MTVKMPAHFHRSSESATEWSNRTPDIGPRHERLLSRAPKHQFRFHCVARPPDFWASPFVAAIHNGDCPRRGLSAIMAMQTPIPFGTLLQGFLRMYRFSRVRRQSSYRTESELKGESRSDTPALVGGIYVPIDPLPAKVECEASGSME